MKINKITNYTNFGLTESARYSKFEKYLINQIKDSKKKIEAQNVANAIKTRVPDGYLDTNETNTAFLLYEGDKDITIPQEVGKVYFKEPFKTLLSLNKHLKSL